MRVLSATDLQAKSEAAIERAALLADTLEATLTLVHAVAPDASDGSALEQRVQRAQSRLAARTSTPDWRWNSRPEIAVQCGRPASVVLDNAHREDAGLLVLGPHRDNAFADTVRGTITEKVLASARCPVLIARQGVHDRYRHVLVALDGSPASGRVLRAVESLGLTQESLATVVHAHEPPGVGMMNIAGVDADAAVAYADASRAHASAGIRQLVDSHSDRSRRYRIMVVRRRPATAILQAVDSLEPDLVVLGTRGHGRIRRALLGSVANEVLNAVDCDVLLVPGRAG